MQGGTGDNDGGRVRGPDGAAAAARWRSDRRGVGGRAARHRRGGAPVHGGGAVMFVVAVSRSGSHTMEKPNEAGIRLLAGLGVEGDAHAGTTVKHRSRVAKDPTQPNLRQVHLIHAELHAELAGKGLEVAPGQMGENVTTSGVDLLRLPTGARLRLGEEAVVELTGLRNPCAQLDSVR